MKSPSKLSKLTQKNRLNFNVDLQKLSELQTSLRKLLNKQPQLLLNQATIQTLIRSAKQLMKVVDLIKAQQKNFVSLQQNYNMMQSKLNNHENIVNNLQKSHLERLKAISDENKVSRQYFDKAKKALMQSQQQAKIQLSEIKKENNELRFKVEVLMRQKQELLKSEQQKQNQIMHLKEQQKRYKSMVLEDNKLPKPVNPKQNKLNTSILEQILCSQLSPKIIQYLNPQQIRSLYLLSNKCYYFLIKSKQCQISTFKSILGYKNYAIKYYHRHIDYFQKIYMKIPQQIIQLAFYRYQITKQNIGIDILQTLNRSAMLFQGKFVQEGQDIEFQEKQPEVQQQVKQQQIQKALQKVEQYNQNARQNIQEMQSIQNNGKKYKKIEHQIHTILQIDPDIVKEYLYEQNAQKIKTYRDINLMYKKIQDTAQLYSADVESIGLFLKNILKNFSKVFVLSKNLYTESRNLQSLNTFILKELSNWQKIQVHYSSQIEDLKAQLQAQSRLKIFFSQKGLKSEQKALNEENIKLTIEAKYKKQTEKLDEICRQKQQLKNKLESTQKNLKSVYGENKQLKKAYENCKQKYKKIIEQLSVVKETILRMNIM